MPKTTPTKLSELREGSDHTETIVMDLTDEEVKKFKIGEKIVITIKGSVGMLSVPPEGSSEDSPAEMGVRMTSKEIVGSNVFAELAEEDSED